MAAALWKKKTTTNNIMARYKDDDFAATPVLTTTSDSSPLPPSHMIDDVNSVIATLTRQEQIANPHQFISADPATQLLMVQAEQLALTLPIHIPVLILGPSGTGKELVARKFIRPDQPFVAVNCAGMPEQLITSILFGHKRGAFTGALQDELGVFVAAKRGTVFLDEIGDMPLHLQPVFLRTLQERTVTRVGDVEERPLQCRIIAATNQDLAALCAEGKFRPDLHARLNMLPLRLKGLHDRPCDILEIGRHLGLTEDDIAVIQGDHTASANLTQHNVRALQAFAYRKRYLGSVLA